MRKHFYNRENDFLQPLEQYGICTTTDGDFEQKGGSLKPLQVAICYHLRKNSILFQWL
jgi:hypothetical protein